MSPDVDVVITFRASHKTSLSKQQTQQDVHKAEEQYNRLLQTLSYAGLRAVGRRGESLGHLFIFVKTPEKLLQTLLKRERQTDFLSGLPTEPIQEDVNVPLAPSDRIRLVHDYITSVGEDGGLGITPGFGEWDLVESVMCLHDQKFNDQWIHSWTRIRTSKVSLEKIRDQFGESIALYFAFLQSYAYALAFPAALGGLFYFFGTAYSPTYSILLLLWSTVFVEWWRVHERLLSLRYGTRGSFRVEKRRAHYIPGLSWWKRELRMVASLPIILLFAGILLALLTGIFVFEAFATHLYTGPGQKLIGFAPTILFAILVPRFLAVYQSSVQGFTAWENHSHNSSHTASLTVKFFALNALVAYLGLALSAFVYVPFGEGIMRVVHSRLSQSGGLWKADVSSLNTKLNPGRLRDQMFAYTVTNQIVDTFLEIGLPFILRAISGKGKKEDKKKVVFEDEKEKGGAEERKFLEQVRKEAALPEYDLFLDYKEMVTQFGYVVLWSTIWPLAPVMALANNFLEMRSDAFKITVHTRRPIPFRTDTIGPWLDALTFLTWLGALTNSALVYLFCPRAQCNSESPSALSPLEKVHQHLFNSTTTATTTTTTTTSEGAPGNAGVAHVDGAFELAMTAAVIALLSSHGYILVRVFVRHIVERVAWKASPEVKERERQERELNASFLKAYGAGVVDKDVPRLVKDATIKEDSLPGFWDHDEGVEEIQRISKEA